MWAGEGREEVSGWIEGYLGKLTGEDVEPEKSTDSKTKAAVDEVKEEEIDGETVEPTDMQATINVKSETTAEEIRDGAENLKI
jgi:hypothetical protein